MGQKLTIKGRALLIDGEQIGMWETSATHVDFRIRDFRVVGPGNDFVKALRQLADEIVNEMARAKAGLPRGDD